MDQAARVGEVSPEVSGASRGARGVDARAAVALRVYAGPRAGVGSRDTGVYGAGDLPQYAVAAGRRSVDSGWPATRSKDAIAAAALAIDTVMAAVVHARDARKAPVHGSVDARPGRRYSVDA